MAGVVLNSKINVIEAISKLRASKKLSAPDLKLLTFLISRAEISGRLYASYAQDGKRASEDLVPQETAKHAVELFKANLLITDCVVTKLKTLNALLKMQTVFGTDANQHVLEQLILELSAVKPEAERVFIQHSTEKKELDLTILFWEGPIARAYLSVIDFLGYKPRKIIHLISANNLATGRKNFSILPARLKESQFAKKQFSQINYWPRKLANSENKEFLNLRNTIVGSLSCTYEVYDSAYQFLALERYSDSVERVVVENINDPKAVSSLKEINGHVLFTGGGLLGGEYFKLPNIKLLHIHPGYLPELRGSDCVLWSLLLKGKPSASCFYMTPNIDDGEIIHRNYIDYKLDFDCFESGDPVDKYRMVFSYVDPWVRAIVLAEALIKTNGFTHILTVKQSGAEAQMFYRMHEGLQKYVFN